MIVFTIYIYGAADIKSGEYNTCMKLRHECEWQKCCILFSYLIFYYTLTFTVCICDWVRMRMEYNVCVYVSNEHSTSSWLVGWLAKPSVFSEQVSYTQSMSIYLNVLSSHWVWHENWCVHKYSNRFRSNSNKMFGLNINKMSVCVCLSMFFSSSTLVSSSFYYPIVHLLCEHMQSIVLFGHKSRALHLIYWMVFFRWF